MTEQNHTNPAAANLSPAQMLEAYDRFMSGAEISDQEHQISRAVSRAASFAAAAYDGGMDSDQGAHALARSFLRALTDPLHPDLDYLRIDPASGEVARVKRAAAAMCAPGVREGV